MSNEEKRIRREARLERVECLVTREDLRLPESALQPLHEIARLVEERAGSFPERQGGWRRGVTVLFVGEKGSGRTRAAKVLAHDLGVELYRIDLSAVVSKYIGETEKNLRRIFDQAETAGAVLIFDEADALFGKRSEVADSHDRYADIEVAYVLERLESYRGLTILRVSARADVPRPLRKRLDLTIKFPPPS
jgi:SpoVK/Ycf46/Vps4 family AAA+-type ATPase